MPTQADPAGGQVVESWALAPTGSDPSQPGSRPTFSYTLAPGATLQDSLTVWNYSNTQLTFRIYATDAVNNDAGAFDLIDANAKPKDAGSWIKIDQEFLTLPPNSKASLGITLTVPPDASPGDHTAGIVAASRTPATTDGGKSVVLDRRVGSRVYLRVGGPVKPGLQIENLGSEYHAAINPLDGTLDVTYTVRNTGNVRLGAKQSVEVHDLFGPVATRKPKPLTELLPGQAVTRTETFGGVAATVRVGAEVKLVPFVPRGTGVEDPGKAASATTGSTNAWAIPWLLVVLLLLLALAILYARKRRRDQAQGFQGPAGGGAVPGPGTGPPSGADAATRQPVG
jgi:LPXTG-motif cell wall-anchored protein